MIVITGATGALNGATLELLLDAVEPAALAVAVRSPDRAGHLAARGVEVRYADYAVPESLPAAFTGAAQLLLVSSNDPQADAVALHRAAIDAARQAGVGRVLYTSHQGAAPDSPFAPARVHWQTEQLLAESGLPWTALRNGFYAHSLEWLAGDWRQSGVIAVPADGPVSWTARADAAAAAAAVLMAPTPVNGPVTITAPEAVDLEQVAAIAAELTGRAVSRVVVPGEEWVAGQVAGGQSEVMARFLLGFYNAAEQGFFATVDPALTRLLGELLGRAPQTVREQLAGS